MIETPSLLIAFTAGIVSFVSPCCLPLVPGYLAAVCGRENGSSRIDPVVIRRSLVFITGFSFVFILLGLGATAIGSVLFRNQEVLQRAAGIFIIGMGIFFIASAYVTRMNRDFRPFGLLERAKGSGPPLTGGAFALAWTPCVGPTLGAILGLASIEGSVDQGAALLAVYSAGLGLPFLLAAVAFGASQRTFGWLRNHYGVIQMGAGLMLLAMGVLVYTDELFRLNIELQKGLDALGLNFFRSV